MKKIKVLLIQDVLQSYRAPIYKIIQKEVDLTLAYTGRNDIKDSELTVINLPSYKVGPFRIQKHLYRTLNKYDVVVSQPHLSNIRLCLLQWLPRKFKLVTWSIGVHATYTTPFNLSKRPSLVDWVYEIIQDGADSCIFYMRETIDYWSKYKSIDINKYFEAHNTVDVADFGKMPSFENRNSFLFVGTLYAQKGLVELIEAYKVARKRTQKLPVLNIIGKGPEQEYIENLIKEEGLENEVILRGAIYDENILKDFFLKAILCISPKQAGLSVQKSLGYGTPFVTRPDAITGGERMDVKNGENGFYYQEIDELVDIMIEAAHNPSKMEKMSYKAREYYMDKCTIELMAKGALNAVFYAINH